MREPGPSVDIRPLRLLMDLTGDCVIPTQALRDREKPKYQGINISVHRVSNMHFR